MKKTLILLALLLTCGIARADSLAGIPTTNSLHATTNYLVGVNGTGASNLEWLISPSNILSILNTVILPRTNLSTTRLEGAVTAGSAVSVASLTSTGAVSVGMGVSTNVAQVNLYETNRSKFWRLQGPDALTNDFIVIPPTNHPTAGQVLSVRAYSGNTVSLTYSNDANSGSLTVKTNGVTLGTESTLNLVAGSGVTLTGLTGTGSNQVTIAASGGSSSFDADYPNEPTILGGVARGQFYSKGADSGAFESLGFHPGTAGTVAHSGPTSANSKHVLLTTSTTSNNNAQVNASSGSLWSNKTNYMRAYVKLTNVTECKFWVGFSDSPTGAAMADHAPSGRFGAAFRLFSSGSSNETVFQAVTFSNAVTRTTDTGITAAADTGYLFEVLERADACFFYINGSPVATNLANTVTLPFFSSVAQIPFVSIYAGGDTTSKGIRVANVYHKGKLP